MPQFRKGRQAAEEAATKGGGDFKGFLPEIKWREDGEKKYILVLTPESEVVTLDLHEFIEVGTKEKANGETYPDFQVFLSRKDPSLDEDYDDLKDRLGNEPRTRSYGVACELEPVMENVRGRQRPKGFAVKTATYTRRGDDGEVEVTQPVVGILTGSPAILWNPLLGLDESQGPFIELPIEVTRRFTNKNTRYEFVPFIDAPIDLSPIREYYDGISYLKDELEEIGRVVDGADDDVEAAMAVADALYTKRLEELADKDRYDELVGPVTEVVNRFDKKDKKSTQSRPPKQERRSPRESADDDAPAPDTNDRDERFDRLRESIAAKSGKS